MATHGKGLVCLALTKNQVEQLGLPLMSSLNKARMQTAFTVSIEAKEESQQVYPPLIEQKLLRLQLKKNQKIKT